MEAVNDIAKGLDALIYTLRLSISNVLSADVTFEVFREMTVMCRHQIVVKRDRIWYELNDA